MSQEQKPLSELIGSIEQQDFTPEDSADSSIGSSKQKGSKSFMIIVLLLLLLIAGMGGYYAYKQYYAEPEPELAEEFEEEFEEEYSEMDELTQLKQITIPDEKNNTEDEIGIVVSEDWLVEEGEYSTLLKKGCFSISITKNPIITGGGWGFMYEGRGEFNVITSSMMINGESVQKVTHVLESDVITDSDLENIFAGSVFASKDSKASTPTLELNNESYLIKYVYDCKAPISIDSQEYIDTIAVMDGIVQSITIE
ncbi:hypothetical protein GX888_00670 [Candidatus Dojkabacteria bacterium]|uniref:Uncharacterized protein n=1 Tax=Candidatus Dojkabacteria bacterium TaxID=2099670 RepID=A0A847VCQ4_9BACT|nr:hypothetical protein [Candidatus Dojkabacteria bacterium]